MSTALTNCNPYSSDAEWFKPSTERAWLALRKSDITATQAAALFGVSPYQTPFDLYHQLAGTLRVEFEENERMRWGKRLQSAIARGICKDNGWKIIDGHRFLYARSKDHPGLGCSPDYIVFDPARPALGYGCLEIKNVDFFVGKDDWAEDEAPPHIEFQLQHQIGVCGFSWGVIGGLVGGNTVKLFERQADAEVIEKIFTAAREMRERVARGEPPAPDYLKDYETLRALYRNAEPGKSINLDQPEPDVDRDKLTKLIEAAHEAEAAAKKADDLKKATRAELLDFLKDTETVFGAGWKVSATTTHRSASVVNYPATTYRNLRITQPKPKKGKS
jgi:putative phage-type endonuclease